MNRLRLIKTAYTALACLMLAACASDELTDGTVQDLPEGKYPLQIAGVSITAGSNAEPWGADTPQTRVAEETDGKGSHWVGEEIITVQLSGTLADGTTYTETGEYQVAMDDKQSLAPVIGKELYWHSTSESTITSWYCYPAAASDKTVDLSNQNNPSDPSSGLAYVLKSEASNVKYNTQPELKFKHQLAQIRVKLTGTKASAVTSVSVKGYTKCTVTEGVVSSSGTEGYISMKKPEGNSEYWEANVIPGTISTTDFVQLTDKNNVTYICSVSNITTLDKAKSYIFNIEVKAKPTPIIGGETITEPGNYVITGNITQTVILNADGINLTLQNANVAISGQDKPAIDITGGNVVMTIEGTNNTLQSSQWGGITMSGGANLIIQGNGTNNSSLIVRAGNSSKQNVSTVGIGAASNATCGDIRIENVEVTVSGGAAGDQTMQAGAAIGTTSTNSNCGNITINNAHVIAYTANNASDCSPAAIGLGSPESNEVKDITISGSTIEAIVYGSSFDEFGACIGLCGAVNNSAPTYKCGTITITCDNESDFLANLKSQNGSHSSGYKIGKGHIGSSSEWNGTIIFPGGTFNGNKFTDGYGSW